MSNRTRVIRIVVDSSGVQTGVQQANAQIASLNQNGAAANNTFGRLVTSYGNVGRAASGAGASLGTANNNGAAFARTLNAVGSASTSTTSRLGGLRGAIATLFGGQPAQNAGATATAFGTLGQSATAAASRLAGLQGGMMGVATAGAALGVAAGIGALVALGAAAVNASAQFQAYRASLTTVLGDTQKAGEAFDALTQFAAKTPFTLDQSVEGFIKLKALGLQPSEEAMLSYGNTASALGKNLNQMVEAVADAATGEFERLKEFGIKSKNQGATVAFTFQGVTTTVKNNSNEIQKYLMAIGNTQFAGAMEKQMATFGGAMSNLEDTVMQTLAKIGDGGLTASIAKVINMLASGLSSITPILVSVGNAMGGLVTGALAIVSGVANAFAAITGGGSQSISVIEGITLAFNVVGQAATVMGNIIGAGFELVGSIVGGVAQGIRSIFGSLFGWMAGSTEATTQGMGNSLIGVLRAGKFLTSQLTAIFSAALSAVGGMFSILGQRVSSFLSGDWAAFDGMGAAIAKGFTVAEGKINGIGNRARAIMNDTKGNSAAFDRMLGREPKKNGRSLAELAGPAPSPSATPDKSSDEAKKAAERAKREAEFWATLKGEVETAKLFGLELQQATKQRELQKIIGRELLDTEKERVSNLVQEIAQEKSLTSIRQASFELGNRNILLAQRAKGLTEDQLKIEDALDGERLKALNAGMSLEKINSAAFKAELEKYRVILQQNAALARQAELVRSAGEFAKKYSQGLQISFDIKEIEDGKANFLKQSEAGDIKDALGNPITAAVRDAVLSGADAAVAELRNKPLELIARVSPMLASRLEGQRVRSEHEQRLAAINDPATGLSKAEREQAIRDEANYFRDQHMRANNIVADHFADKLSTKIEGLASLFDVISNKLGDAVRGLSGAVQRIKDMSSPDDPTGKLLSSISTKLGDGFSESAKSMNNWGEGLKNIGSPLKGLKDAFAGPNGSALKGIGSAIGGAMAGAQMGSAIGGIGDALGLGKGFNKGAQIGGTIGGLTGNPIIAAGASVIGGLIGTVFKKQKNGSANLTGGENGGITLSGNSGSRKDTANSLAGNVVSGLQDIANRLGGSVGNYAVSIGVSGDSFHVDPTGRGKLKKKDGGKDFDNDQAGAIAYAIQDAIGDGAIVGISDLARKALNRFGVDAAESMINAFKSITDELDSIKDPIGYAVRSINEPLDKLAKQMRDIGASSTDLAKIEELRSLKMKDALKNQLSSLTDMMEGLRGDGSGITKLNQLDAKMASFNDMKTRIAAGDSTIDQDAFTRVGQDIFGLARDVYGTATSQFQDIRGMLIGTTQGLMDNVTSAFNAADPTAAAAQSRDSTSEAIANYSAQQVAAANALRQQMAGDNAIIIDLLKQQLAKEPAVSTGGGGGGWSGMNGMVQRV